MKPEPAVEPIATAPVTSGVPFSAPASNGDIVDNVLLDVSYDEEFRAALQQRPQISDEAGNEFEFVQAYVLRLDNGDRTKRIIARSVPRGPQATPAQQTDQLDEQLEDMPISVARAAAPRKLLRYCLASLVPTNFQSDRSSILHRDPV